MRNPNIVPEVPEETLEDRLAKLCEMKQEYKAKKKAFKEQTKHLLESIKSLENIITGEVLERGKTVMVAGIKAEYVPTVVIRLKKEQNNELNGN